MSLLSQDLWLVRDKQESDTNFIYATWLNGLFYGSDQPENSLQNEEYKIYFMHKNRKFIKAILGNPKTTIKVIALKEDPEVILAYSVYEQKDMGSTLHWIFTKPVWRKLGLAKSILPDHIQTVTFLTKVGRALKPYQWKYDPFLP